MRNTLQTISNTIGSINEFVGRSVAWLTTLLVLIICLDVTLRYIFSNTKAWILELEWHLFALIFLLGAGYAFKHDRHVRVDLFYANFSERDKAWINLIGGVVFLVPWCLLIMYVSYGYAYESWLIGEGSPDPGGLPARYVVKFAITAGVFFLFLQAVASIIDSILTLTKGEEELDMEKNKGLQDLR